MVEVGLFNPAAHCARQTRGETRIEAVDLLEKSVDAGFGYKQWVEHDSDFLAWSGFKSYPVPVQKPFPVHIGGSKGKAFERIARHGDGWFAPTARVDQLAELMKSLEQACAAADRDIASIEISAMWAPAVEGPDAIPRYEDLGVDRLIVPVPALGVQDPVAAAEKLGEMIAGAS